MDKAITKKFNFLLYYQCALAIGAILVFFTHLEMFLYLAGKTPPPTLLIIAFGLASTPLLFSFFSRIKYFSWSIIAWCAVYILVSLISFSVSSASEEIVQELSRRILAIIFILLSILIFSKYTKVQLWVRYAILFIVLMSICNILYEFVNPSAFQPVNYSGRPAGFYIDPNKAGLGLILGMIFSVGLLKPKYRAPFVLLVGISIFLTFSRGATLSWFVVLTILCCTRLVPRSQLLYWFLGIFALSLSFGIGTLLNPDQLNDMGLMNKNIEERLEWFQNPFISEDSADSRLEVAKLAWEMFAEHPFLGNGIGSTLELDVGISTHNMYLLYMADHGILGALVMPLLVYAVTQNARGESKYIGFAFAGLILLWSIFSHTVLEDRFILISFSLMAVMNGMSQQEQKYKVGEQL